MEKEKEIEVQKDVKSVAEAAPKREPVRREASGKRTDADIDEDELKKLGKGVLNILLIDWTMTKHNGMPTNIFWATDAYAGRGEGYGYNDYITVEKITGKNRDVIVPRVKKKRDVQKKRSRDMAEVFTPSWICNKQNNLIDAEWFGREGVFNREIDGEDGTHTWEVNEAKVEFPEGKDWKNYVRDTRLEITCGEAPYLVSRYDAVTGEFIPVKRRMGILDRKLRVVGENARDEREWIDFAKFALMNTCGYEWQGDNLLLAREAALYTVKEHFEEKFGKRMPTISIKSAAKIISWNLWQMDGLKCVVPNSCHEVEETGELGLDDVAEKNNWEERKVKKKPCPGCSKGDVRRHNGVFCILKDFNGRGDGSIDACKEVRFVDLLRR